MTFAATRSYKLEDHGFSYFLRCYITEKSDFNSVDGGRNDMTVVSDEFLFCLQHHDGRINVWCHRGERTLPACIPHRHTGTSSGVMVRDAIGYVSIISFSHLWSLNSGRYISAVLSPLAPERTDSVFCRQSRVLDRRKRQYYNTINRYNSCHQIEFY